jgi:hypothetical protein
MLRDFTWFNQNTGFGRIIQVPGTVAKKMQHYVLWQGSNLRPVIYISIQLSWIVLLLLRDLYDKTSFFLYVRRLLYTEGWYTDCRSKPVAGSQFLGGHCSLQKECNRGRAAKFRWLKTWRLLGPLVHSFRIVPDHFRKNFFRNKLISATSPPSPKKFRAVYHFRGQKFFYA